VKDGNKFKDLQMSGKSPVAEFEDTPVQIGRTYYRVQVDGPSTPYPQVPKSMELSGTMVGLSNPLFFNFNPNF
jgi:hypothetical protein